jgi:hypothetical protein
MGANEFNAAMKDAMTNPANPANIAWKESSQDWQAYVAKLSEEHFSGTVTIGEGPLTVLSGEVASGTLGDDKALATDNAGISPESQEMNNVMTSHLKAELGVSYEATRQQAERGLSALTAKHGEDWVNKAEDAYFKRFGDTPETRAKLFRLLADIGA